MRPLDEFHDADIRVLLTDIDGTLTENGRLPEISYSSICQLNELGVHVIPVTGRPAGWCELIARLWPVHGVIGENGAFYFRFDKKMRRHFVRPRRELKSDRPRLAQIWRDVKAQVPGAGLASDQFCRLYDLAVDFCEDVPPLKQKDIDQIVQIFERHGAYAKVSNIHVNGWFGDYDKVSTSQIYLEKEFGFTTQQAKKNCAFVGDSPNDEPMFKFFPHSFGVANIKKFAASLKSPPQYVATHCESQGFAEVADKLIRLLNS